MTLRIGTRVKRVEYGGEYSRTVGKVGTVTGFERLGRRRIRRVYVHIDGQKRADLWDAYYWEVI